MRYVHRLLCWAEHNEVRMKHLHRLLCWVADNNDKIFYLVNANMYWKVNQVLIDWDKKYRGTYNYLGIFYFWAYEYRHYLRHFWDYPGGTRKLRLLHTAMLNAQMDVAGESVAHLNLIKRYAYALDPNERW